MADEKPYEPTPSRLAQARRQGNVPRSPEAGAVAAFGGGLVAALFVAAPIGTNAAHMIARAAIDRFDLRSAAAMAILMLAPAAAAAVAATAASVLQSGGLRMSQIALKFERLAPGPQLARMCSRESMSVALRATVAFSVATAMLAPAALTIVVAGSRAAAVQLLAQATWLTTAHVAIGACAVGALFAAMDFGIAQARWRKNLRMSYDEARRDSKEHDGDPVARGRRRALHRRIARSAVARVKDAAFVVTNPTHLAIALEYRPPEVAVPRVLVRAADDMAAEVRRLAGVHGIPLIENVPLARTLYAHARPGEYVPHETYLALAEIVAALSHRESRS